VATQTDNLVLVEAGVPRTLDATNDALSIGAATTFTKVLTVSGGGLAVTGDSSVSGNLTVTGDIVSRGTSNFLINDAIIDLATGNIGTVATPGGFTVQMNRNSGFTSGTVTTFVAGVPSTSNPTFTYTDATSSTLLTADDIVAITGSVIAANDGLYAVLSVDQASFPQVVTIKGVGLTGTIASTPFIQNQFAASTTNTATACRIDLGVVLLADGTAAFKDGAGASYAKGTLISSYKANAKDSDFTGNAAYTVPTATQTLQGAYNGGATITTSGSTDIALTLASGGFTVNGGGAVDLGANGTDLSSFSVGTATMAVAATSTVDIQAAGAVTIDSSAGAIQIGNDANAQPIDIGTGAAARTITVGNVTGATAVNLNAGTGGMTFSTTGAGDFTVAGSDTVLIDAAGVLELNSSAGAISIGNDAVAQAINVGTGAAARTITVGNVTGATAVVVNAGTGASSVNVTGAGTFALVAGTGTIDLATNAIDHTTRIGSVTGVSAFTAQSGTGAMTHTAGGAYDVNAAGAVTIDSSAGTIGIGTDSVAQNISVGTAGARTIAVGSAAATNVNLDGIVVSVDASDNSNLTVTGSGKTLTLSAAGGGAQQLIASSAGTGTQGATPAISVTASAGGFDVQGVLSSRIRLNANNAADQTLTIDAVNSGAGNGFLTLRGENAVNLGDATGVYVNAQIQVINYAAFQNTAGIPVTAGETVTQGQAVYAKYDSGSTSTRYFKASNNDASDNVRNVYGICFTGGNAGNIVSLASIPGTIVNTALSAVTGDIGKTVYLGTGGALTLTAPSASGTTVFKVGYVHSNTGGVSGTGAKVFFQPQFITKIP